MSNVIYIWSYEWYKDGVSSFYPKSISKFANPLQFLFLIGWKGQHIVINIPV